MRVAVDSLPPGRIGDFVIPFDPADTFSDIKEKICAQEGIPVDNHYCRYDHEQVVMFSAGKRLKLYSPTTP